MSIGVDKLEQARRRGVSIFCASCTKYWGARDAGIPGDRCLSLSECGSPLAGGDFHDYDGPITETQRWCFVCGNPGVQVLQAVGKSRGFGVCATHVQLAGAIVPAGKDPGVVLVSAPSGVVELGKLVRPKRNLLFEEMAATQQQWDEDDAKKAQS